jgi:YceI-like domain
MSIDNNPARSTVLLGLEAVSLTTGNAERNRYLRSSAFLDVVSCPSIILRSTSMRHTGGRIVLDSSLTIRKVMQPQTLHVEELHSSSLESKDTDPVGFTATSQWDPAYPQPDRRSKVPAASIRSPRSRGRMLFSARAGLQCEHRDQSGRLRRQLQRPYPWHGQRHGAERQGRTHPRG